VPTTTEDVETRGQFEQIREAGCTQCQGYLFGRAIPNAEVMRALHQRRQAIRKARLRLADSPAGACPSLPRLMLD